MSISIEAWLSTSADGLSTSTSGQIAAPAATAPAEPVATQRKSRRPASEGTA